MWQTIFFCTNCKLQLRVSYPNRTVQSTELFCRKTPLIEVLCLQISEHFTYPNTPVLTCHIDILLYTRSIQFYSNNPTPGDTLPFCHFSAIIHINCYNLVLQLLLPRPHPITSKTSNNTRNKYRIYK